MRVSLDTEELWDVTLPILDIQNSISVDFHWNKQIIFYSDVNLDVIRYATGVIFLSLNCTVIN